MRSRSILVVAALLFAAVPAMTAESAWTLLDKGIKYFERGEYDRAQGHFAAALRRDARCQDACYYLGVINEKRGKVKEAIALYKRIDPKYPTYSLAAQRMGFIAQSRGDLKTAEAQYLIHAKARPTATSWMQVAEVQLDQEKYKPAEASLAAAAKFSPGNLDLVEMQGRLYMETDRYAEALKEYDRILATISKDSNARYLSGVCLKELHQEAEAVKRWEAVLEIDPWHACALRSLVEAYTGDPDKTDKVKEYRRRLAILKKAQPKVRRVSSKRQDPPAPPMPAEKNG